MAFIRSRAGISITEVMLAAPLLVMVGFLAARWFSMPGLLMSGITGTNLAQTAHRAMDGVAADLREATTNSISYTSLVPSNPSRQIDGMPWFAVANSAGTSSELRYIRYIFEAEPGNASYGNITRLSNAAAEDSGARRTLVLSHVLAPSTQYPLFQTEPAAIQTITMTVRLPMPGTTPPVRLVRKMSARSS